MRRILIRAGRDPFDVIDGVDTHDRNVIGSNNGNLIFSTAAHKLLSVDGVTVVPNYYAMGPDLAAVVNDEYDGFVLPLANAFRLSFERTLRITTDFIRKLKIPFALLSCGAQLRAGASYDSLKPMEETVKDFCRAVLEKSSAITVRGEITAGYIRHLGFSDVLVIGCPSMSMNGRGHRVEVGSRLNRRRLRIAYNIQSSKDLFGDLVEDIEQHHVGTYFPQDLDTLDMMLWGVDRYAQTRDPRLPLRSSHRQFTQNRAEFMLDAFSWMERMRDFDMAVGPRVHGNIVAILAGTPGLILAHDSRTQELAEYHEIPHLKSAELKTVGRVDDFRDRVDFTAFNRNHGERFDRLVGFLADNGFAHIYAPGQEAARAQYDRRIKDRTKVKAQRTDWLAWREPTRSRMRHLRQRELKSVETATKLRKDLNAAVGRIKQLEAAQPTHRPADIDLVP